MTRTSRLPALVAFFSILTSRCSAEKAIPRDDSIAELIGKTAPTITPDAFLIGPPTSLADLKGKVVLLDFWAVWCAPSVRSFAHLREWHKEHHDNGLEVVGVTYYNEVYGFDRASGTLTTLDPNKALTKELEQQMLKHFAAHYKLEHRLWAVDKSEWTRYRKDYKLRTVPTLVLIDRKGAIRLVRSGTSEETAREVEATLKTLLAEK